MLQFKWASSFAADGSQTVAVQRGAQTTSFLMQFTMVNECNESCTQSIKICRLCVAQSTASVTYASVSPFLKKSKDAKNFHSSAVLYGKNIEFTISTKAAASVSSSVGTALTIIAYALNL